VATRPETLTPIRQAIAAARRQGAAEGALVSARQRANDSERRRPAITWADPAARAALLPALVADGTTCPAWYTGRRASRPRGYRQNARHRTGPGRRRVHRVADSLGPPDLPGRSGDATWAYGYKSHQLTQSTLPAKEAWLITAVTAVAPDTQVIAPMPPGQPPGACFPRRC